MRSDLLHLVGVYSNPRRYKSRLALTRQWLSDAKDSGAMVMLVAHAFGERPHDFDDSDPALKHVHLVRLRGGPEQEVWLKEALVNAGIARLPEEARYICWEDTDIRHVRADWAAETVQMLQHYRVGQTWSHSIDLGPNGETVRNEWGNDADRSFSAAWTDGDIDVPNGDYGPSFLRLTQREHRQDARRHYGYSWAIRRDVLKGIGRLIDWMVTGSADYHMALGFSGALAHMAQQELADFNGNLSSGYIRRLREFARRCDDHVRQDIGCVPGTVLHSWHGTKTSRYYIDRKHILLGSGFDPDVDLAYDANGLPMLVTDNRALRDGLRRYFVVRNEDAGL